MAEPSQSWNRQAYTLKVKMQSVSDDAVRKRLLEKFATSPSTVSYSETCLRDFGHKSRVHDRVKKMAERRSGVVGY